MRSEQQVKNTISALYSCYCGILKEQCGIGPESVPSKEFFVMSQTEENRVCDVGEMLNERDKHRFCILAFQNLLGTVPTDDMLQIADTYTSIEKYQRKLVLSILISRQFKENNVIAVNIPWTGGELYKMKLVVILKSICSLLPKNMQKKVVEIYKKNL